MTDLEITKLCAEAIGIQLYFDTNGGTWLGDPSFNLRYDPLRDDAQAMALVKKFHLRLKEWQRSLGHDDGPWWTVTYPYLRHGMADSSDLNRAICECVANMRKEKEKA